MGWMAGQAIPRIKRWEKARPAEAETRRSRDPQKPRPAEAETHEELFDRIAKSIQNWDPDLF